jgi:synaptosomal-associated protein 25
MDADDSFIRKGNHLEQRQKLGLTDRPRRSKSREHLSEPTSGLQKVEVHRTARNTPNFLFRIMSGSDLMSTLFIY